MGKKNVSATVDEDVYEFLQQDHINNSGLINRCLREYMNTGGDVSAVRDLRIRQLEDEANDLESRAENKRERADELRQELQKTEANEKTEQRKRVLEGAEMIPADPSHPFVQQHADDVDMTPKELAEEIADYHAKELVTDCDDDLNSL